MGSCMCTYIKVIYVYMYLALDGFGSLWRANSLSIMSAAIPTTPLKEIEYGFG